MLAFTFPGQGSQRAGMGAAWVDHPSWEVVSEASEIAKRDVDYLLRSAPMEELTNTANAQLACFVLSLVVLDAVERMGLSPAACAGHSLGEYTALVAGGAVAFHDGIALVAARGDAMARAGEDNPGTMAALLGISDDDAEAACQRAEGSVWVANYNAPGQVVVAGTTEAIGTLTPIAKELGAKKVMAVAVSGAFHTPMMELARPLLRKALADVTFYTPEARIVANVDARVHDDPADWPSLCSAQLCSPVRWRQCVDTLANLGVTTLIELGPGNVLTGLARRCAPDLEALAVQTPGDLDRLMDVVAIPDSIRSSNQAVHHGEHLYMSERVVVSPAPGVFSPEASLSAPATGLLTGTGSEGTSRIEVGDLIGQIGNHEVRTPFGGIVVRWLAVEGERVQQGQPLVWLHAEDQL